MRPSDFTALFSGPTQCWFDWDLLAERGSVRLGDVLTRADLAALSTVWYSSPQGQFTDWRDPSASRLNVAQAASHPELLPTATQAKIRDLQDAFEQGWFTLPMVLPVYRTAAGERLIIDGNHRATAMYAADSPVRIIVAEASGVDTHWLTPDLLHGPASAPLRSSGLPEGRWAHAVQIVDAHFRRITADARH